ncbi:hypothetical protein PIB30_041157 [Stylosanthes scabra]|uniref:Uncharacterized protein n=1 Tax=Stylosanthes scabra TaxID=79078 RepID=A0ABU6UDG6_9FABA|nr:hypothetical protein [Stylosanthes scabra]
MESYVEREDRDRFVRFVSTPAILERFVNLGKEILHIESSFQANALSMSTASSDEGTTPQANGITRRLSDSAKLNGVIEDVDNKEEESSKSFKILQPLIRTCDH